ncbi:unnamed protein product [Auanema sp. JU1783]|nr:unnamed protein product [Auanema sp. JU1783]
MDRGECNSDPAPIRRNVRPNFAEDVYGEKASSLGSAEENSEYCDSSLAHRRQQPTGAITVNNENTHTSNHPENGPESSEGDLEFMYNDTDVITNELAELYSYSELEDFAKNFHCWRVYADEKQIEPPYLFTSLPESRKKSIFLDLCCRIECADAHIRLSSSRIILYILQGAFADFIDEEDMEAGVPTMAPVDRGTGGFEMECVRQAFSNVHLAYTCGVYQALCSLLLAEMNEPFDCGLPLDGRISKASSRDSRNASNCDLSDNERKRRTATLADNESLRVVLSSLYHMVELMRNDELTSSSSNPQASVKQKEFISELEEPLDNYQKPLISVLFEMMPVFYTGNSPHYPMKKVFLLIWKVLLATLGGWKKLDAMKKAKRTEKGLPVYENNIDVAQAMPATVISDGDNGARMAPKRSASRLGTFSLARQSACSGSEETKDEEENIDQLIEDALNNQQSKSDRQNSGDRTPRAGSPALSVPPKKGLPWKSKVNNAELDIFIQSLRQKFFNFKIPGDTTTMFGFPPPIIRSVNVLRQHIYTSLSELQAKTDKDFNRYLFSTTEKIELTSTENLYRLLLPNLSQYVVAILKVLLAAAPSNKAKSDALNILVDVLTPETDGSDVLSNSISLDNSSSSPLEDSVRLAIDIHRHKEILVKASSSILLLLCKHFKLNHVYQFEYLCQHVVFGNGIPLLLKFLDQNMTRHIQSRYEIHAYNYPQAVLHYVRNREEWPTLNPDNVEENPMKEQRGTYYMWRNIFSSINIVRVLNKLVKAKQSRVMMLVVFKSAPILKRSLKVRLGIFQFYVLKALKMQSRYLGRQWRRTNMDIISAIYNKVRHRLTDDWAYASEMRKSYDYHPEENELKADVERFHSRRYGRIYPQFAIEVSDAPMPGDDYLNRVDLREFEPVDSCFHSVLGVKPELGDKFVKHYSMWVDEEVMKRDVDWDKLLMNTRGIYSDHHRD